MSLRGDGDTTIGNYTGQTKMVPSSWVLSTPNKYLFDVVMLNFHDNANLKPYSTKVKVTMPGKYKINAIFHQSTLTYVSDYNDLSFWSQNSNVDYPKSKAINVQGKVNFKVGKGKLKKKSQKARYVTQKGKVGSLPKVKAKKGYKFKGWYTKKKGGKKITKSTKVKFTGASKTYYAQYKKK